MRLSISMRLTYSLLMAFFLSASVICPIVADDSDAREAIGNLSARIEELENQISGQGGSVDDKNPGAHVTPEDFDRLRDEMRALKDTRQNASEDMHRLQDEVRILREDISQLQKENASLRQSASKKTQTQAPSPDRTLSRTASLEEDDETESVLKLLEQSAPGDEEEAEGSSKKKHNKKNLESIREAATKHAEEGAPALPGGDAEAQYNEAFALYDKGAYKEAERAFDYFIKTYPKDPLVSKALYWKAECCLKQGKHKEAKILFVNAYKKNPKGPKAPHCLLKLGEALATQGRKEDACTAWLKLKTDFPHMTSEMQSGLTALKKKHGCEKKSETAQKPAPAA